MAGIETLEKRSTEVRLYDCDFSHQPECDPDDGDENLVGVVVSQTAPTGSTPLTLGAGTVSGKRAQVLVSGGTTGYTYVLNFTVTTNGVVPKTLVGTGRIKVVDVVG